MKRRYQGTPATYAFPMNAYVPANQERRWQNKKALMPQKHIGKLLSKLLAQRI
jgi:hypothetical protein